MTDTLTRERVETIYASAIRKLYGMKSSNMIIPPDGPEEVMALCRLALKALDPPAPPSADVVEQLRTAIKHSAWKHNGDDTHSAGMDAGAVHQIGETLKAFDAAISALGWKEPQ